MEGLGLDIKLLIAQIVNFGLLFFILKKLLYKPIIKMLDDRKKTIEESLLNSKKIEEELNKLEERKSEVIGRVQKEAQKEKESLIALAVEEKKNIVDEAKKSSEAIVAKSVKKIQAVEDTSYENIKKRFLKDAVNELEKKIRSSGSGRKFTDNILK